MLSALRHWHLAALALLFAGAAAFGSTAAAADTVAAPGKDALLVVQAVDTTGKPVEGALVNVFPVGGSGSVATGNTDANGKLSFVLPTGDYNVFASKVFPLPFPTAIFGSATFKLKGKVGGGQVVLNQSAP